MATRKYTDLDLAFLANPVTGDVSKNVGDRAVTRSILNLIQTNHYERKFHPGIGSNMIKLLFEQPTALTANALQNEITNVITNYEPRATIRYLSVTATPDLDGYYVRLDVFIDNQVDPVTITTFLERIT